MGVTSEVGPTTDQDLAELKKYDVFYTSVILEVTWYEPLYNKYIIFLLKERNVCQFPCPWGYDYVDAYPPSS